MSSTRSTILASRGMFNGDIGRCSAQIMILGGLMALPGAIITGLGSVQSQNIGEFYILGPVMLSIGLLLVIAGIIFKVLIVKGIIKPANQARRERPRQRDLPQSSYPWMTQPSALDSFPPPYTIAVDGSNTPVVPLPPMYSPTSDGQPPAYVNEAFSPLPAEPPPTYEEAERTKDKVETTHEEETQYIEAGTSQREDQIPQLVPETSNVQERGSYD